MLRTFGHKSSSFFDRRLSVGSLKTLLVLLAAAVLLAVIFLAATAARSMQPLDGAFERIERINMATHAVTAGRWQIERYLASGVDYAAAEGAAQRARAAVTRLFALVDDYQALNRLEETSAAYLNLLRSYRSIAAASDVDGTLALLRDQLSDTAIQLDQQAAGLRAAHIAAVQKTVPPISQHILRLAAILLLALGVLFGVSMALVTAITRHSTRILGDIREVTCQISAGNFDARINLTGEHDQDIVQLGLAFNRMADKLNLALQSELAATEQNRLQILKLARQERVTAILEERQRIARELHDSVKQQLFSITLSAGAVINLLHDAPPLVKTHLEHIKQAGHSAQSEMTVLLQELVSVPLQDKRLEDALLDYLNPLCATHGLKLLWRTEGTNTLTIAQEHALFRAVQEAVSNVVRHSGATVLRVSIRYGLLTHVVVEDNGKGFALESVAPTSNGLAMMRARLMRVGGRYELQTAPGGGTRLTIQLDLRRR